MTGSITTANGPVSIGTGTGTYAQQNVDISAGSGTITVTADDVEIVANTGHNAFQTSASVTLMPYTAGRAMTLGADATGQFALNQAELADIAGGIAGGGSLIIGDSAAATGLMTIGGSFDAGAKTLSLHAGAIAGVSGSTASAGTLNLNAATGNIGAAGTGAIRVSAASLTVNTQGGDAYIQSAADLAVGESSVGAGLLQLKAGGAITQTAGTILADRLCLDAGLDIGTPSSPIRTAASHLTARSVDGGITIANAGALIIGGAGSLYGMVTAGGNGPIHITTAGGPITLREDVTAHGTGSVTLDATGGSIDGSAAITGSSVNLRGETIGTFEQPRVARTATITATGSVAGLSAWLRSASENMPVTVLSAPGQVKLNDRVIYPRNDQPARITVWDHSIFTLNLLENEDDARALRKKMFAPHARVHAPVTTR